MLIAQISDLHISAGAGLTCGVAPMADNLRRTVAHINALELQPDLVLITGDITHDGTLEQAEIAEEILAGLRMPFYVIGGNHDDRGTLWQVFGGGAVPSRHGDFLSYVVEGHELALIGLDSVQTGESGGEVCVARADWLSSVLPERPALIFMHHPPIKVSVLETDLDGFIGDGLLAGVVKNHPNIQRIICGHIHLPTHAQWHGTAISTAPSIGMQLRLDLTMTRASQFYVTEPAYMLHHWTAQKSLISHVVQVKNGEGPYPF